MESETTRALMLRFESLGDNCEFAIAQRACGAEPAVSLLRWAFTHAESVIEMLEDRCQGLLTDGAIRVREDSTEWRLENDAYALIWHTFAPVGSIDRSRLLARERRRIELGVMSLIEHLTNGSRIFVIKRNETLPPWAITRLIAAIRSYGRAPLLWVSSARDVPAYVTAMGNGAFHGIIPRFADYGNVAADTDSAAWLKLCSVTFAAIGSDVFLRD